MPMVVADDSAMTSRIRSRNTSRHHHPLHLHLHLNSDSDPNSPLRSSSLSNPTISSILLSSSTPSNSNDSSAAAAPNNTSKKKNFSSSTFRGFGCTASSQVSVPAAIRSSANWDSSNSNKLLKKKRHLHNNTKKKNPFSSLSTPSPFPNPNPHHSASASTSTSAINPSSSLSLALSSSCVGVPDVWCGPGVGLFTDAASVDCVVSRRHARGKLDAFDRILPPPPPPAPRERPNTVRRMVAPEDDPFLDSDTAFVVPRSISASRHFRHARHGFREGLAEIVMFQNNVLMGGRSEGLDRYRDMRLDVDNMSYEELLELGEQIGYVSTGLGEDDISRCVRRAMVEDVWLAFASEMERKCSICQEECQRQEEMGKLRCGHGYHMECIRQWLGQKNSCPICKTAAVHVNVHVHQEEEEENDD